MRHSTIACILLVILPYLGVPIAAYFTTRPANEAWYDTLSKPSWAPPKWTYPVVWTIIYGAIGVASYIVWEHDGGAGAWVIYALQLLLNWPWPAIFFGLKDLKLALLEIVLLFVACVVCGIVFGFIDYVALVLFIPYWLWMMWLLPTSYSIWKRNPKA